MIERAAEVQRVVEDRNADGGGALGPAWPAAKSFMHRPVYFLLKWFSIDNIQGQVVMASPPGAGAVRESPSALLREPE